MIDTETEMIEAAQQLKDEAGPLGDGASKDVELVCSEVYLTQRALQGAGGLAKVC